MTISTQLFESAKAHLGTWEWAEGHNPKVLNYYALSGHGEVKEDEVPWCAAFVGAVLAINGLPNTGSLLARSYADYGEEVSLNAGQTGDIVVLKRGNSSWQGHVGFLHSYQGDKVMLLGGNQGNQVNVSGYSRSKIIAIRRPLQPKASLKDSTTVDSANLATAAGALAPVLGAISSLDWKVVMALGMIGLAIFICMRHVKKERAKWFANGAR